MYTAEQIAEVRRLLAEGHTQEEVAGLTGTSERTIRGWKSKGKFETAPPVETTIRPTDTGPSTNAKAAPWPEITAEDLTRAGCKAHIIAPLMATLQVTRAANDRRLALFIQALTNSMKASPSIPEPWQVLIAGYPIVAEDTHITALKAIADLASELQPYLNKRQRQAYHRRVRPLLTDVFAGVPALMLAIPFNRWTGALVVNEDLRIPLVLRDKWFGWLADMVTALPDVDKKNSIVSRLTLTELLLRWCSTPLASFNPPIPSPGQPPNQQSLSWMEQIWPIHNLRGDTK